MPKNILSFIITVFGILILNGCSFNGQSGFGGQSLAPPASNESLADNSTLWQRDPAVIWARLQRVALPDLQAIHSNNPVITGWINLATISKQDSNNTTQLTTDIKTWRKEYPNHPANTILTHQGSLARLNNPSMPQHIAVLLPLQGPYAKQGKTIRDGFLSAYYANLAKTHITQTISFYDTNQTSNMSALYQKAISEGADFVVGPLVKENVQALANQGNFSTSTLALNYTNGTLPDNFYEFGLSPLDEAQQVADKARDDGHSRAIIIATESQKQRGVVNSLIARWQADGGSVQDVLTVSPQTNINDTVAQFFHYDPNMKKDVTQEDNNKILAAQGRHDFDVVFLLTPPQQAREIVPLIKYYYVSKVGVYATSIIYSGSPSAEDIDLNGVVFPDTPWTAFSSNGKDASRLYAVGRDAYALTNEIPRLKALPNFPLYGATGALTLNSNRQIYRRLPWMTMHNGHT